MLGFFFSFSFSVDLVYLYNHQVSLMPVLKKKKKRFIDKPLNEGRVRFILSVSLFYLLVSFDDSKVSRNTGTRNNYVFNLPRYLLWFVIFETKKKCKGGFFRCNVLK